MSIKEKDRTARKAYKKKIETVRVELYPTDEDIKARIAERLEAGEPKATYIKRLIRQDMVRRGSWTKTDEFDEHFGYLYKCSVCGRLMIGTSDFCPCCGADMRK